MDTIQLIGLILIVCGLIYLYFRGIGKFSESNADIEIMGFKLKGCPGLIVIVIGCLLLVYSSSLPSIPHQSGSISVSSSPIGASIYLDNVYQAKTPTTLYNIKRGNHNITLKLAGYEDWSQTISVDTGKTTSILETLIPNPIPEIKINYSSDTAQIAENITGTAKNIPDGYELWILVYPHAAKRYYPQHESVNIQNGEWSVSVGIGTEDNVGDKFDIIAVLADKEARAEFTSYIIKCEETKSWPGMDNIPNGAKEYARVIVVRDQPLNPEIKINYSSNTAHIKENITGVAKNIPKGDTIWIVVYPHKDKYYPQSEANIRDGNWSLPQAVGIGSDNDYGVQFDIIAVLADQKAHEEFKNYFEICEKTKSWPGMDKIPESAKICASITVTRV